MPLSKQRRWEKASAALSRCTFVRCSTPFHAYLDATQRFFRMRREHPDLDAERLRAAVVTPAREAFDACLCEECREACEALQKVQREYE
jgi:hypothetical protein